jgi:hypothetical protein
MSCLSDLRRRDGIEQVGATTSRRSLLTNAGVLSRNLMRSMLIARKFLTSREIRMARLNVQIFRLISLQLIGVALRL